MANVCLEVAELGQPVKPHHVQFIALRELADLLGGLPIAGCNPAMYDAEDLTVTKRKRVEAVGRVSSKWMVATCSDLAAAIRAPMARIARIIRRDLADGGELVMFEQIQTGRRAFDQWEHISDPRRGLRMRLDYVDHAFTFSVLYQIRYTPERPKLEWLDRPQCHSLAGAD